MKKLFNFKHNKENDAKRIYSIYKNVDIKKRINYIVNSEYKRMIYYAERTALNGETIFPFELVINEKDKIHSNIIISEFITKIVNNGFGYSRQLLNNQYKMNIYFSQTEITN